MFLLAEGGGEHTPLIVEFINYYLGKPVLWFETNYTQKFWDNYVLNHFGTTAEKMFGPYTVENAIPWYTIMFVIACLLTMLVIWVLKGKLSEDDPRPGQLTLEAGVLAIKDLVVSVIGEHGFKYFPVVGTFAVLVLISNLMGLVPLFMSPTAHVSVTFALGNRIVYLLQLRRHQRKRHRRAFRAFDRTATADFVDADYHAFDFLNRIIQ